MESDPTYSAEYQAGNGTGFVVALQVELTETLKACLGYAPDFPRDGVAEALRSSPEKEPLLLRLHDWNLSFSLSSAPTL